MKKELLCLIGFWVVIFLIFCILIFSSCEKETYIPGSTETKGVPVHLSVSLCNDTFFTDSQVVPMLASQSSPYIVAWIQCSELLILKKVGERWIVEDIKENPLESSSDALFREGDKLTLRDKLYTLRPGTYKFILFVNAFANPTLKIGSVVRSDECVTSSNPIGGDAFSASSEEFVIEKTNSFNKDNINTVELKLERRSALIRMVLENETLLVYGVTSITFDILTNDESPKMCVGMNAFGGDLVCPLVPKTWQTDFSDKNRYSVDSHNWYFPLRDHTSGQLRLYADDEQRYINIRISKIGVLNFGIYPFEGDYMIEKVPVQRNRITVVVIKSTKIADFQASISHELNPEFDWNSDYPPFDFIELNNN